MQSIVNLKSFPNFVNGNPIVHDKEKTTPAQILTQTAMMSEEEQMALAIEVSKMDTANTPRKLAGMSEDE